MRPIHNATETRARPRGIIPTQYIKGYTINRPQLATTIHVDISNLPAMETAVTALLHYLNRDAFSFIACGARVGSLTHWQEELVIVLDQDWDEETLRGRPLEPPDRSLTVAMPLLEGPFIWLRTV